MLDRNFLVLAQLLPGAAPLTGVNSRFAVTKFGGLADQRNGYTTILDGGAIDDSTWGSPVINMPQDAVQEFKVFRNQFEAQYGSALNAVVNVVTKSGGNNPSGTGYYFGRDKALNARNAKAATVPPFKQTRAGGTYGGPIVQQSHPHVRRIRVPDHRQSGDRLASRQQSRSPRSRTATTRSTRPSTWPTPGSTTGSTRPSRCSFAMPTTISSRRAAAPRTPPAPSSTTASRTASSAEHNWVLSQNTVNTLRVHYLDHNLFTEPTNFDLQEARPSYTFGQNGVAPQYFPRKIGSFFETFYINTPRHDIKIGGEFTHASSNFEAHFTEHGAFTFLTDTPFNAADSRTWPFTFVQQTPGLYNYSSNQIAAFVQDDWRVTDRLRLNLGLRYDLDTSLRQNDLYADLLANPLYSGLEQLRQRRSRQRHQQPAAAPRRHLRHPRQRHAGRPCRQRSLRDAQPAVAAADVDGQDARVGGADHRSAAAQELPGHQRRARRQDARRVRQCRRRALALSDRRRLRAALLVQYDGRHRLADQRGHLARRRLRAQRRHRTSSARPTANLPASGAITRGQSAAGAAVQPGGRARQLLRQLVRRARGAAADAGAGHRQPAGVLRLLEELARRRHLLQHLSRHRPDAAREGPEPDRHAAQPQRGGVDVAALGRAAERRVPGDQRRAARRSPRASTSTATSTPRTTGRSACRSRSGAATSTSSSRSINAFRATRNQAAVDPELLEPDPIIGVDVRLTKAFSIGGTP